MVESSAVPILCSRELAVGESALDRRAVASRRVLRHLRGIPAVPVGVRYAPGGHVPIGVARECHDATHAPARPDAGPM